MRATGCRSRSGVLALTCALALTALLGLAPAAAHAEEAAGPDVVVGAVADDLLELIRSYQDADDVPAAYYETVDERMADFVDYPAIAQAVMARYWAQANPAQRERFVEVFRRGLVRTYARALLEFEQQKVAVLPVLPEHLRGNRALVRMEITGANGRVYPLQYSMAQDDAGTWRVRNVIVDGVNLGVTYRNQFASAMASGEARGDLDAVIEGWTIAGP